MDPTKGSISIARLKASVTEINENESILDALPIIHDINTKQKFLAIKQLNFYYPAFLKWTSLSACPSNHFLPSNHEIHFFSLWSGYYILYMKLKKRRSKLNESHGEAFTAGQ